MRLFPLRSAVLVRVLQAVATIGLLAAIVGTVVGWGLLGQLVVTFHPGGRPWRTP